MTRKTNEQLTTAADAYQRSEAEVTRDVLLVLLQLARSRPEKYITAEELADVDGLSRKVAALSRG